MDTTDDRDNENEDVPPVERQLEQVLHDAEAALAELRMILAEQRLRHRQHEEIERLPEHLANTTVRWSHVKVFFDELIAELRGGHQRNKDEAGSND